MSTARRWGLTAAMLAGATLALSSSAQAATYPAWAGAPAKVAVAHLEFDHFFNPALTVHVGDTVKWTINGFHTVSFPAKGTQPPAFVMPGSGTVNGVKDAAGNPLWFNGKVPSLIIDPLGAFPIGGHVVTGATYVSSGSGAPGGPARSFSAKFTKAGTFKYFCLVHPGMTGVVKVVAKSRKVPSAKLDARSAKLGLAALLTRAKLLAKVKPGPARVYAGSDAGGVTWLRFFPSTLKVKVGQPVQFVMRAADEIHTVTFGPPAYTTGLETSFATPVPNPMGPPTITINPLAAYPSDPGAPAPLTPTSHGNGFENSGILSGVPSPVQPMKVTFTFAKPGTYHFECVVHPNMDGTVVVTA